MNYKELIWVSKELADEYKKFETVEEQERLVKKIIERKGIDINDENELLSENMLQFKNVCLLHKKELEKVYNEQAEKLEKLWNDCGDITPKVRQHAKKIVAETSSIGKSVDDLNSKIDDLKRKVSNINVHIPEQLVRLAETVSSMDDKSLSILKQLLEINNNKKL